MIKNMFILMGLLLLCSACVSRTTLSNDALTGTQKEVIKDKKLIWFWQSEFYK
jgi:hypothetical protein